jgi:arginyl-tRNA--protein-N-Asp/Glu arginylyltransferase
MGLEYLYLGYWIRDCQKMSYKADYRPLQVYQNSRWATLI